MLLKYKYQKEFQYITWAFCFHFPVWDFFSSWKKVFLLLLRFFLSTFQFVFVFVNFYQNCLWHGWQTLNSSVLCKGLGERVPALKCIRKSRRLSICTENCKVKLWMKSNLTFSLQFQTCAHTHTHSDFRHFRYIWLPLKFSCQTKWQTPSTKPNEFDVTAYNIRAPFDVT